MTTLKAIAETRLLPIFLIVMIVGVIVFALLGYLVFLLFELNSFISSLIGVGYG